MAKPIAGAVQPLLRDLDHLEVVVVKGKPPREDGCQKAQGGGDREDDRQGVGTKGPPESRQESILGRG